MQLQTTSTEATMALGGTAVKFEKPLNFYAGWRKNVLPCSNKARYKNLLVNATTSNDTTDFEWTAVELEKSLNFYAGWRKYFIIQIFLFYVFQKRIIQFLSILLFSFGALVFSVRDKN